MIRTVGLTLLSGAFVAGGFLLAERHKKRYRDTEFLLLLIQHIKREICTGKTKLSHCFSLFADEKRQTLIPLFETRHFDEALSKLVLPKRLQQQLLLFFSQLGKGDTQEESLRCERMIELLIEENRRQKDTLASTVKVYRTLGVCIAGVLLLLFL